MQTKAQNNMARGAKTQQTTKPMQQIKNPVLQVLVFQRNQRQRTAA